MTSKDLNEILDYLKIIQVVYGRPGWAAQRSMGVDVATVSAVRKFFNSLCNQLPLETIAKPTDVYPVPTGDIGIEWSNLTSEGQLDLFYVEIKKDFSLKYRSVLDTLETSIENRSTISDTMDEVLLIHIKHFN